MENVDRPQSDVYIIGDATLVFHAVLKLDIPSWKFSESFASLLDRLRV